MSHYATGTTQAFYNLISLGQQFHRPPYLNPRVGDPALQVDSGSLAKEIDA